MRPSFALSFALLVACGSAAGHGSTTPTPGAADEHAGKVSGPGAGTAMSDCSDWRSWVRVNDAPFVSKGHGGKWVDVYVEAANANAYRARTTPAPAGMRVVKAGYKDQGRTQFEALTVMGKMPAGYDPEHGDWYYGVLKADGKTALMQGKLEKCVDCHSQVAEHDYLFGLPQ